MRNKPINPLVELESQVHLRVDTDERPVLRLVGVLILVTLPLLIIAGRVAAVQSSLTDHVVAEFEKTSESLELIPSRDGRILGGDGQVLAHDVRRFHLKVHYRWLEEPPDELWVRQQALKNLPRRARRNPDLVKRRTQEFLEKRNQFWERLSELTVTDPLEIRHRRGSIQKRVERIVESVERRRHDPQSSQSTAGSGSADERTHYGTTLWNKLRRELTTSPDRFASEPIIVREELQYHRLIKDISFDAAMQVETRPEIFPGAIIERATERYYPLGEVAAHAVGVRSPLKPGELEQMLASGAEGLKPGDRVGRSGLESQYDEVLRGRPGLRREIRNRAGEIIATEILRAPENGKDIHVALNLELQRSVESILDQVIATNESTQNSHAGASLVVIDVRNGHVVTLANAPRYDLNLMLNADEKQWRNVIEDQRKPLFPRASRMALPPGSVFKTISSLAILQSGMIDPDEPFFCQGFLHNPNRYRCYTYRHYGHGHSEVTLLSALTRSCNVYFYTAAEKLGPQTLIEWAGRFGIGDRTGIDLPGEVSGNLPTPSQRDRHGRQLAWYKGDSLGLAIGQSRLTTTPIQIARAIAAIANGGYMVVPRIVTRSETSRSFPLPIDLSAESMPKRPIENIDVTLLERVREGMDRVVNHPSGTGYKTVRSSEIRIAGKTGTAEVGGGRPDHAWFAGYVPANEPRYAFAVVVEHGGSGGRNAGPIARQLVERMLELDMMPSGGRLASGATAE